MSGIQLRESVEKNDIPALTMYDVFEEPRASLIFPIDQIPSIPFSATFDIPTAGKPSIVMEPGGGSREFATRKSAQSCKVGYWMTSEAVLL
jgi:hypothetical protein